MNLAQHFAHVPEDKKTNMRPYRPADIPLLVECVAKFVPELPNYADITVDKEWVSDCLTRYYGNVSFFQCWVITDEHDVAVGCSAGYCVVGILTKEIYASDAFWFVLPNWRTFDNAIKLLRAYKQWALARNAVRITATTMSGFGGGHIEKMMEREGFDHVGSVFSMRMDTGGLARRLHELRRKSNV